jgi:thioredoxin-related protein
MKTFSINSRFLTAANLCLFLLVLFGPVAATAQDSLNWHTMKEAQKMARHTNKKVLVFVEEQWSIYCKKMKDNVFSNQSVIDSIRHYFYPVKLDISSEKTIIFNKKKMTPKKFARRHHIKAMPTTVFLNENGKKLAVQPGFISSKKFKLLLGFIGSESFHNMSFKTYLKQHGGN